MTIKREILIDRLDDLIDEIKLKQQEEFDTDEVDNLLTEARLYYD